MKFPRELSIKKGDLRRITKELAGDKQCRKKPETRRPERWEESQEPKYPENCFLEGAGNQSVAAGIT